MTENPVHLRGSEGGESVLPTVYERVGGMQAFDTLARRFYEAVQQDEVMWPMYDPEDLEGAIWRLGRFLAQYWGGPATYSAQRGHPRLRMRHVPFAIDRDARERWLRHMTAAVDSMNWPPMIRTQMLDYFDRAATAMINRAG